MSHFNKDFNVIYIRVVQGCNLNCTHCFTLGNRDEVKLAPLEQIRNYLQSIKSNVNPKKAVFYIHGGETFLAPLPYLAQVNGLIREIFEETQFNIIPQTNLMYKIDQEYIDFIKREYGNQIGISWDAKIRFGSTSRGLSEELFFNNFRELVNANIDIAIAVTVQNNLLEVDPLSFVGKFDGAKSVDFEFLTIFDDKTRHLKVDNLKWSKYFAKIVEYYATHDLTWSMPQVDLFTKSFLENRIYQCKCNCCEHRTFTMNVNGSVGLCPDDTYINPISSVIEMTENWSAFEKKALQKYIMQKCNQLPEICTRCKFFDYCGGNCEPTLFDENQEDCPLSQISLEYQFQNIEVFKKKLQQAKDNLVELKVEPQLQNP